VRWQSAGRVNLLLDPNQYDDVVAKETRSALTSFAWGVLVPGAPGHTPASGHGHWLFDNDEHLDGSSLAIPI
jgi:hypothetical protein